MRRASKYVCVQGICMCKSFFYEPCKESNIIHTGMGRIMEWQGCRHVCAACCVQKLQRRRALGSGPQGALQAAFSADQEYMVAAFRVGLGL